MPRIPVRTTPYHTLPRCTRHYKSKRDLILRALGKASFINGSQFVIAWISPKGEVDVYASELLQGAVTAKDGGVLNRKELEREAGRCKGEMSRRWEDIRRLEEKGEAPVMEDEGDEVAEVEVEADNDDEDGDKTLVEDGSEGILSAATLASMTAEDKKLGLMSSGSSMLPTPTSTALSATSMMSTFPANANPPSNSTRQSTPAPPMHTLTLGPDAIENYYTSRFAALQQATCKLVVKAWIKVIEPKKQMKFPYNKGEDLKPTWWPAGVRHREPDHLSKTERLTLLTAIVRSSLITVSRLELSTAEAAAFISRPRLAILREVYLVAKEEEKRRLAGETSTDLIVHLPNVPVSPSAVSPEAGSGLDGAKRSFDAAGMDKENAIAYANQQAKRIKASHAHSHSHRHAGLAPLATSHTNYYEQPFTYAAHVHPSHLSPYPSELYSGSEYGRSPNPDGTTLAQATTADGRPFSAHPAHGTHLAPLLNHHAHSPADSPAFPQTATLAPPSSVPSAYYGRSPAGQSYMQQQQMEYLQAHGAHTHYDYGSPYLADPTWDGQYAQPA